MNPEIKAQWLAALRSGKYKQGTGALRAFDAATEVRYCCLGVLCDILINKGVVSGGWKESYEGSSVFSAPGGPEGDFTETGVLPEWAMIASGIESEVGYLPDGDNLARLNDKGMAFSEIANVIEESF